MKTKQLVKTATGQKWEFTPDNPELLPKVGDEVEFTGNASGRGGHSTVTGKVSKVNRKTFEVIEGERSYRPGTLWSLSLKKTDSIYLLK